MKIVCEQLRALAGQLLPGIEANWSTSPPSVLALLTYDGVSINLIEELDPDESTSGHPTSQVFMLFYLLAKDNNKLGPFEWILGVTGASSVEPSP